MFKIGIGENVAIKISNECGFIKGRAEYNNGEKQYFVHYKDADNKADTRWFDESDLLALALEEKNVCQDSEYEEPQCIPLGDRGVSLAYKEQLKATFIKFIDSL